MSYANIDLKTILPIITLILGTVLGILSSLLIAYFRQRENITSKILDHYFRIRGEICEYLSEFANLEIGSPIEPDKIKESKQKISNFYYKYYDFLPQEVLTSLNCLYACLKDKDNRLYKCKHNTLVPLEESDLEKFILNISIVENFKYYQ